MLFTFSATVVCLTNIKFCLLVKHNTPFYFIWIALLLTVCFGLLSFSVLFVSIFNAVSNLTTNELAKRKKYDYLKDSSGNYKNLFDRGIIYNIKYFFHLIEPSYLETASYEYNPNYII
jgi:hypothetical protein